MADSVSFLARGVRDRLLSEAEARDYLARMPEDLPLDPAEALNEMTITEAAAIADDALRAFKATGTVPWS